MTGAQTRIKQMPARVKTMEQEMTRFWGQDKLTEQIPEKMGETFSRQGLKKREGAFQLEANT